VFLFDSSRNLVIDGISYIRSRDAALANNLHLQIAIQNSLFSLPSQPLARCIIPPRIDYGAKITIRRSSLGASADTFRRFGVFCHGSGRLFPRGIPSANFRACFRPKLQLHERPHPRKRARPSGGREHLAPAALYEKFGYSGLGKPRRRERPRRRGKAETDAIAPFALSGMGNTSAGLHATDFAHVQLHERA
jgi:hypothetical protein